MIKHLYSLICNDLLVDQITKRASYINIITDGNTIKLPNNMPSLYVVTSWYAEGEEKGVFQIRITFISPSGDTKELLKDEIENKDGDHHRYQLNLLVKDLPVKEEGMHYFLIEHKMAKGKWKEDNRIPLYIKKLSQEQRSEQIEQNAT